MLRSRTCPLCGAPLGDALLTITQPDRFERSLGIGGETYRRAWRACGGCGASVNEHLPQNHEKLEALDKNYYEVDLGNGIDAKYRLVMNLPEEKSDNAGRAHRVLQKLLSVRAAQRLPRLDTLKVVDVGAGTGVFLAKLGQLCVAQGIKLDAVAMEPDPIAAQHLRNLDCMRVEESILDEAFQETDFDLVTFNKVLEHIEFPVPVVEQGLRIINQAKGLLYAEVPDVQTIYHRPSHDNILGALHHHLYAPNSLDAMMRKAGLVMLDVQRIVEPSGKLTVFGFSVANARYQQLVSAQS